MKLEREHHVKVLNKYTKTSDGVAEPELFQHLQKLKIKSNILFFKDDSI